ncbi:MAG: hypothetical protein JXA44_10470 [Methanospirillaceae archaeon]|nr:hypothetical protein [Methanospirillaceae archaeon]
MTKYIVNRSLVCSCIVLIFMASASASGLLPPGDHNVSDEITLQGVTNFNTDNQVLIEVYPASFKPARKFDPAIMGGVSGVVPVQKTKDARENTWSFTFDTAGWSPDLYMIRTEVIGKNFIQTETFNLLKSALSPGTDRDEHTTEVPDTGTGEIVPFPAEPAETPDQKDESEEIKAPVTVPSTPLSIFIAPLGIATLSLLCRSKRRSHEIN